MQKLRKRVCSNCGGPIRGPLVYIPKDMKKGGEVCNSCWVAHLREYRELSKHFPCYSGDYERLLARTTLEDVV